MIAISSNTLDSQRKSEKKKKQRIHSLDIDMYGTCFEYVQKQIAKIQITKRITYKKSVKAKMPKHPSHYEWIL